MIVTIELHELLIEAAGIVVRICQRGLRKTMTALSQLQPGLLSWFGNIIIVCVTCYWWLSAPSELSSLVFRGFQYTKK
jgi:hypothetical protein